MKFFYRFFILGFIFSMQFMANNIASAAELFDQDTPVQNGINVFESTNTFAEIFEKLDSVKWAGKNVSIAIEGLEKIHKNAHIAVTDDRVVLVWGDNIVGNWPRPGAADWNGFGQITTAIVLKLREFIPDFGKHGQNEMYSVVVSAVLQGIDENGKYIHSRHDQITTGGRLLTSAGIEGVRDERGNFRIFGIVRGSAADNNGLTEGDLISEINGQLVSKMGNADLAAAFSGFNSGTLKLHLIGASGSRDTVLRRATIVMADADIVLKQTNDISILEIIVHKISDGSVDIVNESLAKYKNINGIVLDLRSAGGDDETAAAKLGGLFIGKKPILRIIESAKSETEIVAGGDSVTDVPVVILTSGATSGTAESLAAAFYENSRGTVIGTPTAGKARLATKIDLSGGGQLELLNRAAKTGQGKDLDGRGFFPLICLSNIRNSGQQEAFFINISNGDFNAKDFNQDTSISAVDINKGCPQIKSGSDEDALSSAVSFRILSDQKIYNGILGK